jgi:hypothetical protein
VAGAMREVRRGEFPLIARDKGAMNGAPGNRVVHSGREEIDRGSGPSVWYLG